MSTANQPYSPFLRAASQQYNGSIYRWNTDETCPPTNTRSLIKRFCCAHQSLGWTWTCRYWGGRQQQRIIVHQVCVVDPCNFKSTIIRVVPSSVELLSLLHVSSHYSYHSTSSIGHKRRYCSLLHFIYDTQYR